MDMKFWCVIKIVAAFLRGKFYFFWKYLYFFLAPSEWNPEDGSSFDDIEHYETAEELLSAIRMICTFSKTYVPKNRKSASKRQRSRSPV